MSLSRLFPINDNDILRQKIANAELNLDSGKTSKKMLEDIESNLQEIKPTENPKSTVIEDWILEDKEKIKIPHKKIWEASIEEETPSTSHPSNSVYSDFMGWRLNPSYGKVKTKPNAIGKLWKDIKKEDMLPYNEEEWLTKLTWITEKIENKKLTMIRLIFGDPLFTPIKKESIQELIECLSNHYPRLSLHVCFSLTRELTKEEKRKIMLEANSTHLGEKNTIEKARKIGLWHGLDDIKKFVQSCPICQL